MEMEKKRCSDDEDISLLLLHKQGGCLIQEILVWLPVASLLRFKAVCKSWRDLIQSPSFIHLHTTLNSSSSKFGSFIVHVNGFIQSEKGSLLMLSSPSDDDDDDDSESEEESVPIPISGGGCNDDHEEEEGLVVVDNLGFEMHNKEIVGSCNGLVCIRDKQGPRDGSESKPIKVSLWNPATGKGVDLPESIRIPRDVFSLFVFGFDVKTKDYKVVRFTGLKPRRNGNGPQFCFCRVQVYSLSTNSWRLLEDDIPCLPGYPFRYPQSVVYLNNGTTCFFLAHFFYTRSHPCLPRNDRLIISFDFTKEIITPIQLPDHHRNLDLCLCSLGHDKLVLFTSTNPYEVRIRRCQDFNIWLLNYEQGSSSSSSLNKESWKELHSFQLPLDHPYYAWIGYTPRGISNDGKFALVTSDHCDKMNLYNFATKKVTRAFLSCRKVVSKCYAYKPSLVSVIGGNGAGEMVQEGAAADMEIENSATNL